MPSATPFRPQADGAPVCDLNGFDPDAFVPVPLTPSLEWFSEAPEWMTPGYSASVALCGEEAGRVAFYVAEFDKAFLNPYVLPGGRVMTHHPRGVALFEQAWQNPLTVMGEDGKPTLISAGLFGFEHSPDEDADSFDSLAADALEFHNDVRSTDLGDVRSNPLAALAYMTWGEDEVGPFMVGALAPNVRYRDAHALFSAQVSTELLFDGQNFYALPAAAVPIGNAQRSRIAAATSRNGPREYSMRVLAATTMVAEPEETVVEEVDEEEEEMPVDLSALETQLGTLAQSMGESLEAMNQRIESLIPEPEPEPETWEAPLSEFAQKVAEDVSALTTRLDEIATTVESLNAALEQIVDDFLMPDEEIEIVDETDTDVDDDADTDEGDDADDADEVDDDAGDDSVEEVAGDAAGADGADTIVD